MAHSFKVGDRAVIVHSFFYPERVGMVVTVTSPLRGANVPPPTDPRHLAPGEPVYSVALPIPGPDRCWAYRPRQLESYRPDGSERGEWTEELRKLCGVREDA